MAVYNEREESVFMVQEQLLLQGGNSSRFKVEDDLKSDNVDSWQRSYEKFISTWTLRSVHKPCKSGKH